MVESGCVPLNATLFHLFNKKNANQYIAIKSYIPPCRLSINDSSMAAKRWWMASQGFGARKSNVAGGAGWVCVAVTVALLAKARICGCTVGVDTISGRSDKVTQRTGTDQRSELIGVTSWDLSGRADLKTGGHVRFT